MELGLTIGAVGAALIGALISLLGLIISKESKVSEFRQAWIDALRSALTTFLANINSLVDLKKAEFLPDSDKFDREQILLRELNSSYYQITLRVNSDEILAKDLQRVMVQLSKAVTSETEPTKFDSYRVEFIKASGRLLKAEWARVKRGEPVYRLANWIAGIGVLAFAAAGVLMAFGKSAPTSSPAQTQGIAAPLKQDKAVQYKPTGPAVVSNGTTRPQR